ncbi:MAG: tRNA (adenosine(37)-N6)-threonylcarbamoyltransferase complex transferase subunit TsaD [Candidatus Nealsonbacteria bacterium]|nr:tRNA (adenosine(37)-N6)-threonylcarbamoyltransferase complex transferase subunit TsaD [Candidatus Nealsonbacteria bacterium]
MTQNTKVLGIDTSCDDTAMALLEAEKFGFRIISNVVSSQVKIHQQYGGVYPFLAKREHQKNLPIVFKKVLQQAKSKTFDMIGVTVGPGLEPCLWQGINFAKEIAVKHKKSLITINHIEAHILANFIERKSTAIKLPAVCLVVSGGHTTLFLMKKIGRYELIGETLDDAAGEALDKIARILGLGYPGGPAIAAEAKKYKGSTSVFLPRPMMRQKNYNFSFSGLKTAVLYKCKARDLNAEFIQAMCAEAQQAVIDVLLHKTLKAARDYKVKTVMLGGGVVANEALRKQFGEKLQAENFAFIVPSKEFCTDNGAMIAAAAYFHRKDKKNLFKNIAAQGNLAI